MKRVSFLTRNAPKGCIKSPFLTNKVRLPIKKVRFLRGEAQFLSQWAVFFMKRVSFLTRNAPKGCKKSPFLTNKVRLPMKKVCFLRGEAQFLSQ